MAGRILSIYIMFRVFVLVSEIDFCVKGFILDNSSFYLI